VGFWLKPLAKINSSHANGMAGPSRLSLEEMGSIWRKQKAHGLSRGLFLNIKL
jgi:hypothetical protein